jgi:hypothetical protein
MRPLRAFLYTRDAAGEWSSAAFRELEPLLDAWHEARARGADGAALHVGFWRPETGGIARLVEFHPGFLLVSEAAAHALPLPVRASARLVGEVEGLGFRLVLSGFGYEIEDPTDGLLEARHASREAMLGDLDRSNASAPSAPVPRGWVADLDGSIPDLAEKTRSLGIWNEETYQALEHQGRRAIRLDLGLARFAFMIGAQPSPENVLDNIRACPPWLTVMDLNELAPTVRQANVFRAHDLNTVSDIQSQGTNGLMRMPNMGRKSVKEFAASLYQAFMDGPKSFESDTRETGQTHGNGEADLHDVNALSSADGLRDKLIAMAQILKSNESAIWKSRMGLGRKSMTLQDIAETIDVTRERVRQIERKAFERLKFNRLWNELSQRLDSLLEGRSSPLILDGLAALDPWFEGSAELAEPLAYVFDRHLENRFSVVEVDGSRYVSRLSQAQWDHALRAARRILEDGAEVHIKEEDARPLINSLLADAGEELQDHLWMHSCAYARFVESPGGERELAAYGRSADRIFVAILQASESPLHVSEIKRKYDEQEHADVSINYLRNIGKNVGFLFGRGIYGLLSHCPLDQDELAWVRAEIEDLISGGAADHQWHSSELLEALLERGMDFQGRLTKYVVNIALSKSDRLADLRRMVWGLKSNWKSEAASRLDVRQAVVALLEREGRPLTTGEVRSKLEAERGVNTIFQIQSVDPIIRVEPGIWGLSHRDMGIALVEAERLVVALAIKLRKIEHGLHVSELSAALGDLCDGAMARICSPHALIGVAQWAGIKIDRGQYLYLDEWGESRRITIQDAVRAALSSGNRQGVSFDEVFQRVCNLTRRDCSRNIVIQALKSVDARLDPETGLWTPEESEAIGSNTESEAS